MCVSVACVGHEAIDQAAFLLCLFGQGKVLPLPREFKFLFLTSSQFPLASSLNATFSNVSVLVHLYL